MIEKINSILNSFKNDKININTALTDIVKLQTNKFSDRDIDFVYLIAVFNVSGIDGLHNEIQRLKKLGKEPHQMFQDLLESNKVENNNDDDIEYDYLKK